MRTTIRTLHEDEAGHIGPFLHSLVGVIAAVALTWGVVADVDWVAIVGGAALAVAFLAGGTVTHVGVDYPAMARLEAVERSQAAPRED